MMENDMLFKLQKNREIDSLNIKCVRGLKPETLDVGIYVDVTLTCIAFLNQTKYTPLKQWYSLEAVAFLHCGRTHYPAKKLFIYGVRNMTRSSRCCLGLQIPQILI